MELQSVKGFSLCALKKLSSLSSGCSCVSLLLTEHKSTWRNQLQEPSQRLVGLKEQHPGVPPAPGHLGPVLSSTMALLPDLHQPLPCSRLLFFPLLPLFCVAPFSCNLFRAGTRCVCSYKGLRTMCPRWFVQVPSRQPRGFILQERNP